MSDPSAHPVDFTYPILLSALAGSATGVGGLLVYLLEDVPSDKTIALALAYAAGVMMCLSIVDLLIPMALRGLGPLLFASCWACVGALLCRAMAQIKVPSPEELMELLMLRSGGGGRGGGGSGGGSNGGGGGDEGSGGAGARTPSALHCDASPTAGQLLPLSSPPAVEKQRHSAWRVGVLLAIILTAHNLPEGLAVAVGTHKSEQLGLALAVAIFFHNVAEGAIISIPLMRGVPNRRLAVGIAALTGLTEPLGALLGLSLLQWVHPAAMGAVVDASLACVAGIMIEVSLRELLPLAMRHASGEAAGGRLVAGGVLAGALSIGATLLAL